MVKIVPSLESKCQFTIVWNLSPNLIHESRKKKMLRTSITDSSSSRSLMTGSAPLTYLIVRPLYLRKKSINHEGIFFIYIMWSKSGYIYYLLGRSLLIKACTWGYAPKRHPHTSRMAFGYLDSLDSKVLPSSVQQLLQLFVITCLSFMSNLWISSQEEHSNVGVWKPRERHSSRLWRDNVSITNWDSSASTTEGLIFTR